MGNENVPLNYYFFFISRDAISAIEREGNFAEYYAKRSPESCFFCVDDMFDISTDLHYFF